MTVLEAALAGARWLFLLAELQVFGALAGFTLIGRFPLWQVLRPAFLLLAGAGMVWTVLQAMEMADPASLSEAVDGLVLVVSATVVGHAAVLRAVAWLVTALVARWRPRLAVLPAGVALALHAAAGHAAAEEEPVLIISVVVHLLAAGAWLGGLLPLRLALRSGDATDVALRFSRLGLVCVVCLGATAFIQANALAGGVPGLVGTEYGHLLLVKLSLFIALLVLAARNRFVLTPRLAASRFALDRTMVVELGMGLVLLAAAALLAGLPPGAHEQPDWPFAWRLSFDAMADDDLRAEVVTALLKLAGAAGLVVLALAWRRVRWPAVITAAAIAWFAVPHLDLLLVPAEPTYYWQSESAGNAGSIASGAAAFASHCVACHGAGGKGDGPLAAGMSIPPADLTAEHLWEHSDGELFWWISHGMEGPDGAKVMPGFAGQLDEITRWELIDFLHANNPTAPPRAGAHHHH